MVAKTGRSYAPVQANFILLKKKKISWKEKYKITCKLQQIFVKEDEEFIYRNIIFKSILLMLRKT